MGVLIQTARAKKDMHVRSLAVARLAVARANVHELRVRVGVFEGRLSVAESLELSDREATKRAADDHFSIWSSLSDEERQAALALPLEHTQLGRSEIEFREKAAVGSCSLAACAHEKQVLGDLQNKLKGAECRLETLLAELDGRT